MTNSSEPVFDVDFKQNSLNFGLLNYYPLLVKMARSNLKRHMMDFHLGNLHQWLGFDLFDKIVIAIMRNFFCLVIYMYGLRISTPIR